MKRLNGLRRTRLIESYKGRPNPYDREEISFNDFMRKINISQEKILKKSKRIQVGRKGDTRIAAAEWVDEELIENIKKRGRLSRRCRIARKTGESQETLDK